MNKSKTMDKSKKIEYVLDTYYKVSITHTLNNVFIRVLDNSTFDIYEGYFDNNRLVNMKHIDSLDDLYNLLSANNNTIKRDIVLNKDVLLLRNLVSSVFSFNVDLELNKVPNDSFDDKNNKTRFKKITDDMSELNKDLVKLLDMKIDALTQNMNKQIKQICDIDVLVGVSHIAGPHFISNQNLVTSDNSAANQAYHQYFLPINTYKIKIMTNGSFSCSLAGDHYVLQVNHNFFHPTNNFKKFNA
jgi:hypothetical protein